MANRGGGSRAEIRRSEQPAKNRKQGNSRIVFLYSTSNSGSPVDQDQGRFLRQRGRRRSQFQTAGEGDKFVFRRSFLCQMVPVSSSLSSCFCKSSAPGRFELPHFNPESVLSMGLCSVQWFGCKGVIPSQSVRESSTLILFPLDP